MLQFTSVRYYRIGGLLSYGWNVTVCMRDAVPTQHLSDLHNSSLSLNLKYYFTMSDYL